MESNMQKMRDALVWLQKTGYRTPEGGWMCITLKMTEKDGMPYPIEVPPYAEDVIKAALSEPPRNCDVLSADQCKKMFENEMHIYMPKEATDRDRDIARIVANGVIDALFAEHKGENNGSE